MMGHLMENAQYGRAEVEGRGLKTGEQGIPEFTLTTKYNMENTAQEMKTYQALLPSAGFSSYVFAAN